MTTEQRKAFVAGSIKAQGITQLGPNGECLYCGVSRTDEPCSTMGPSSTAMQRCSHHPEYKRPAAGGAAMSDEKLCPLPEPEGVIVVNTQALRAFTADQMREYALREVAAERERCMGKLDSHGRYWVENRVRILDALTAAGFQLMSGKDRFWLAPLLRDTAQKP